MGFLREITEEYLGALQYVKEVPRDVKLSIGSRDIVALVGPRRAGKTFLMLKAVKNLLDSGEQALYISFDELQIRRLDARKLAEMAREEYPRGEIHLFLDEIQEWENWDSKIRWLHDVKDFFLYVTGSSSALQSSEIPSRLRGVTHPFSSFPSHFARFLPKVKLIRSLSGRKGLLNGYLMNI